MGNGRGGFRSSNGSLDVFFYASLLPSNCETYVSVEVHVISGSNIDIVAILFSRVLLSRPRIAYYSSSSSIEFWSSRLNVKSLKKILDISEQS